MSLIKKATEILSDLIHNCKLSKDILSDNNKAKIDMALESNYLKFFKENVHDAMEFFEENINKTNMQSVNVANALLNFLADPVVYMQKINYTKFNLNDPTNQYLQYEIVNLAISYIEKDVTEFKMKKHHETLVDVGKNTLLY